MYEKGTQQKLTKVTALIRWRAIYPVDTIIHFLNNPDLKFNIYHKWSIEFELGAQLSGHSTPVKMVKV